MNTHMDNPPPSPAQQVEALRDAITHFGQAHIEEALDFMLGCLCHLVDAQGAYWVGTVLLADTTKHDPLSGRRPKAHHPV